MEEQQIIDGLRAGDRKTTEYLYAKYSRALFTVILRIIPDRDIAEEVFHDAFVKIVRKIDGYDESKGRLYTWMANICRNAAIDKTRSKEFSQTTKTNPIDDFVNGLESESATAGQIDAIGIKELMDHLTPDQRFVIEYIYFQGYTHSEIAEEFEIPLGTVKSRIRAAIGILKTKLGNT